MVNRNLIREFDVSDEDWNIAIGDALPDEGAADLVRNHLLRSDVHKGFIIDGFPATAGQAKALDKILQDQQLPKAVVVVLEGTDEVIRKRMLSRGRTDDKPENIDRRIQDFRKEAALLMGWAGQTHIVRMLPPGFARGREQL